MVIDYRVLGFKDVDIIIFREVFREFEMLLKWYVCNYRGNKKYYFVLIILYKRNF